MTSIESWIERYKRASAVGVNSYLTTKGTCKKVLGARALFAEVEITISSSDELHFTSNLSGFEHSIAKDEGWLEAINAGVLDVMLVRPLVPISIFECSVNMIRYHEIDSSVEAFRLAGRYAAEEFLSQEKFVVL